MHNNTRDLFPKWKIETGQNLLDSVHSISSMLKLY